MRLSMQITTELFAQKSTNKLCFIRLGLLHQQIIKSMHFFDIIIIGTGVLLLCDAAWVQCSVCKYFAVWHSGWTKHWRCGVGTAQ